jgi:hypothetical protein
VAPLDLDWQVAPSDRQKALEAHNDKIRDGRDDAILYYPGSGADIIHPLFGAGEKTRYFIFVDTKQVMEVSAIIKEELTKSVGQPCSDLDPPAHKARRILDDLKISSTADAAWTFSIRGRECFLFYFSTGHKEFLEKNGDFQCDIIFDKDPFTGTWSVDVGDILRILRVDGYYSSNDDAIAASKFALGLVGLTYVGEVNFNGPQFLYRRTEKIGSSDLTRDKLEKAWHASYKVIYNLNEDEESNLYYNWEDENKDKDPRDHQNGIARELAEKEDAMLEPFISLGITLTEEQRKKLCREIAMKFFHGTIKAGQMDYVDGINQAFGS